MAYCEETDLLLSGGLVTGSTEKAKYLQSAADEIDAKLGYRYATPIAIETLPANQRKLLKTINAKLASGRLIMSNALGGQDASVNAYAHYLIKEAEMDLMSIANGQVDLAASLVDATGTGIGTIADPTTEDTYARIPTGWNPDQTSAVTVFEKTFLGGEDWMWTPGQNIANDGTIKKVR